MSKMRSCSLEWLQQASQYKSWSTALTWTWRHTQPPSAGARNNYETACASLSPRNHATPRGERRPAGTGKKQYRNVSLIDDDVNFLEDTGLSAELFTNLYHRMLPVLTAPRITADGPKKRFIARTWTPMSRLYMVVRWLRHMETYRQIARIMGGSAATVSREIWDLIPKLYVELRNDIRLPTAEQVADLPTFLTASGAIDCTSHVRNRVHPWSTEYYRGDKHAHFITAQLVCALRGTLWDVALGPGHNNDQGMMHITGMERTILDGLATRLSLQIRATLQTW